MIRLRIEGLMLELLMERALGEGARFSAVRREGARTIIIETDEHGAKILQALCDRFSIGIKIEATRGLPKFIRFLKRRFSLIPGLLLCAILLFLYTQHIWRIDVAFEGERPVEVTEAEVQEMLAQLDVVPGMRIDSLDTDQLALELSAKSETFSFVGARIQGVRLLVELAPSLEAPDLYNPDAVHDLVAKCDGVIVSINAQAGVASVKAGDTVRKGEVLIRGEERVTKEETRGIAARGEVIARTWITVEAEADTHAVERMYTGRTSTGSMLSMLEWSLSLTEAEPLSPAEIETEYLPVGGLFLPLMIVRTTQREYAEKSIPQNVDALKENLASQALELVEAEVERIGADMRQIVDKWIDYSMIEEGRLQARAVVELHQDIVSTREALLQGG